MKKLSRKLNLHRETLLPLQSTELDQIHGGAISAITATTSLTQPTRLLCIPPQPSAINNR